MSFYRWCMRFGAAILFAIAMVQLVLGLIGVFQLIGSSETPLNHNMASVDPSYHLLMVLQALLAVFASAALPFFGALLIERLDRWLAVKGRAE
ncbi:hypothetical protein [Sphingosinicella sp.]|uniref:hypothetical protein n=1 Tax=Sphingosinicella sp. TaxID=1917971 RepID=UPI004037B0C5